jgi:hypothetical protein
MPSPGNRTIFFVGLAVFCFFAFALGAALGIALIVCAVI